MATNSIGRGFPVWHQFIYSSFFNVNWFRISRCKGMAPSYLEPHDFSRGSRQFRYEDCPYILSGYMGDNGWSSDELILLPTPKPRFEVIKNMTIEEMSVQLIPMIIGLCEEGIPCEECVREWLESMPAGEK